MFDNWYSFRGNIGRLEFFLTFVACVALFFVIDFIKEMIFDAIGFWPEYPNGVILWLCICAFIPTVLFAFAAYKRCIDAGIENLYTLVAVCPIAYIILALGGSSLRLLLLLIEGYFVVGMWKLLFYKSQDLEIEESENELDAEE